MIQAKSAWTGHIVFVEAHEGRWAAERTDHEGKVLAAYQDDVVLIDGKCSSSTAERIESVAGNESRVYVQWQPDRVRKELGGYHAAGGRVTIDLYQLTWLLVVGDEIRGRQLAQVARWCEVSEPDGTAASRVKAIRLCYFKVVNRLLLGMEVTGIGRELMEQASQGLGNAIGKLTTAFNGGKE